VSFAPSVAGVRTAAIHIANNTSNANPFDIALTGMGNDPANPVSAPVANAGGPAPGAGASVLSLATHAAPAPIAPAGDAKLTSVGVPAVNEAGDVIAFLGQWNQTTGTGSGLFTETECLAAIGAATPIQNATYKTLSDPVVGGDTVAFIAKLAGVSAAEATAVFLRQPNVAPTVLAQTGKSPLGVGDATFKKFKDVAVSEGNAAVFAQLAGGTGANKVTGTNANAIWVTDANGVLKLVLREGQPLSGINKTIKKLVAFMVGKTSPGQGRGWLTTDSNGNALALALATFTDGTTAVVQVSATGFVDVLSKSGTASGDFASYGVPAANSDAAFVFFGTHLAGNPVTKTKGIFAGTFEVAHIGGSDGTNGETFSALSDPVIDADGSLAFFATLKGANVKGLAGKTLWNQPAGKALKRLAQGGNAAGDLPGSQWSAFTSLAIGSGRGPIFAATLVPGKGNVTKASASGVWACDPTGKPRLLFRTDDSIVLGGTLGTKKVKSFKLLNATVGSVGVTRSFNDRGRVVWQATFTDKTTAIITTEVP
jgi:hypothetical protein